LHAPYDSDIDTQSAPCKNAAGAFRRFLCLKMNIVLNGEQREVEDGITLAALLDALQLEPRNVAVEVNMDLVPRTHHAECALSEDDRVEIVTLVGGG
jgi:sulfur carrier protein